MPMCMEQRRPALGQHDVRSGSGGAAPMLPDTAMEQQY